MMRTMIFATLALGVASAATAGERYYGERYYGHPAGIVADVNPTRLGLHDYAPPTPVGRGHGNAYVGAGYIEFLYSGGGARPPALPPRRVYVGPLESEPYGNRRVQLRHGMSPRAGTYVSLPEYTRLPRVAPYWAW
jgi:hypothetical protein